MEQDEFIFKNKVENEHFLLTTQDVGSATINYQIRLQLGCKQKPQSPTSKPPICETLGTLKQIFFSFKASNKF